LKFETVGKILKLKKRVFLDYRAGTSLQAQLAKPSALTRPPRLPLSPTSAPDHGRGRSPHGRRSSATAYGWHAAGPVPTPRSPKHPAPRSASLLAPLLLHRSPHSSVASHRHRPASPELALAAARARRPPLGLRQSSTMTPRVECSPW
jgi:hypothetical protein